MFKLADAMDVCMEEVGYGYYVYGIMGRINSLPTEKLPGKGIDPDCPVYALPNLAVQAIVSKVSMKEFGQKALEANLHDMQWLADKVHAHESILEAILPHCTLIPMRLCTIFRSESRVREMLAEYHDDFINTLAHLEGRKEWGVKVYVDASIIAQKIGKISDRVKRLEMEIAEKSGGAAYLWKRKLDDAIAVEIDSTTIEYVQRSHDRLSSHAEDSVTNPLRDKASTGRTDEMILNGAYLVADEHLEAFRTELADLGAEYGFLGFSFHLSGPWPPYNFVAGAFSEDRWS